MPNFEPVRTMADIESLDETEIIEGYSSAEAPGLQPCRSG